MTIDEAIRHAEEVAKQQIARADALDEIPLFGMDENDSKQIEACYKCAEEHRQLAEWLLDYKRLKEQEPTGHWIIKIKSDLRGDMWPTNPKCSECGGEPYYSNTIYNYKFCPYCGVRMESEKNE